MRAGILLVLSSMWSACGAGARSSAPEAADPPPAVPPSVLTAQGHLDCTISSKQNGHQKLVIASGQGLEFDIAVSPILDGVVKTDGPDKGGFYKFTSHLVGPGTGTLSGVGAVVFDSLDTKVNVAMTRYRQPGGPGTELSFTSDDMASRGMYVEFAGKAHTTSGDHYAFRVTLGAPGAGSGGKVQPATDANTAPIAAKVVEINAPQTTVVTTTVQKLP